MSTKISKSPRFLLGVCAALLVNAATGMAADLVKGITMVPQLVIEGTVGANDQVQYCTNLSQPNWMVLTNVLVTESPYRVVDMGAVDSPGRLYRVVRLSPEGMVLIPAGGFTMGDDQDGNTLALPVHEVYVSAFCMDRYEVTKALWDEVKAWNGGNGYSYENAGSGKAANHPVHLVNWRDCVKWCNARSQKEGRTPCYYNEAELRTLYKSGTGAPYVKWDANGYRLPTEAEWERAARGGTSGQRFPWGNTISWSQANYYAYPDGYAYDKSPTAGYNPAFNDGASPFTSPAGYFEANAYGLYDMAGNVWEWCWDWHENYSDESETDPHGPDTGLTRVYRGGGWGSGAALCRLTGRYHQAPEGRINSLGFRTVVRLDP